MSATGRNLAGHERQADDFYATPAWTTRAILPHLALPEGGMVLDPCCGEGAILNVLSDGGFATVGLELDWGRAAVAREAGRPVQTLDALTCESWPAATAIVTNPPYALAQAFLDRALMWLGARPARVAAFLLRLNYLGSQKRALWHRAHPADIYVLPRRPSFTPDGKTDATEYAWWIWGAGRGGRWYVLDVDART